MFAMMPEALTLQVSNPAAHLRRETLDCSPLVERDGLAVYYDLPVPPWEQAERERITSTFISAFNVVWDQVPSDVRSHLLRYWGTDAFGGADSSRGTFIRLDDLGPWSPPYNAIGAHGHEMTFPISLVLHHPDRLKLEIARTVVHAYRYATAHFWRLYAELVDEPFSRWEQVQEEPISDTRAARKLATLEKAYLREHARIVAEILGEWGFSSCAQEQKPTDVKTARLRSVLGGDNC
jgi:hypothetical protein